MQNKKEPREIPVHIWFKGTKNNDYCNMRLSSVAMTHDEALWLMQVNFSFANGYFNFEQGTFKSFRAILDPETQVAYNGTWYIKPILRSLRLDMQDKVQS